MRRGDFCFFVVVLLAAFFSAGSASAAVEDRGQTRNWNSYLLFSQIPPTSPEAVEYLASSLKTIRDYAEGRITMRDYVLALKERVGDVFCNGDFLERATGKREAVIGFKVANEDYPFGAPWLLDCVCPSEDANAFGILFIVHGSPEGGFLITQIGPVFEVHAVGVNSNLGIIVNLEFALAQILEAMMQDFPVAFQGKEQE